MQISTDGTGIPQKAIDGSTSAFFSSETCSLTKPERVPWWYVNLLEPYMVQLVRLDFGKSCCGNKPATIVVRVGNNRPDLGTNPICNKFTGVLEEGQPLFLPCNPPMPGAFVSVHLENSIPSPLSICEAFVYTDQALPIERCPVFRDQPPGASASYNGKCYIFYNRQPLNLRNAMEFCRSRGGTLINESNPALQGFISWELWRRHRSDTNSQYWMGAIRDAKDRNTWKWINGEEVSVSFWNLPGGDEDCARYDGTKGWLWSDTNCNMQLNFICQHQPKACGRPEQPPNSTMIAPQGFTVGAAVDYACDEGHLLVGPGQRTCLETGFYDEFPPVCKHIECGLPASISHGTYDLVNASVSYLSSVIYKCNEGYEMVGRAMLTCDIDERWNGPPPKCEPIECEPLPEQYKNGKIYTPNGTLLNARAEMICPKGYKIDGPRYIKCTNTGQWNEPLRGCIREESAPSPPPIQTTSVPVTQFTRSRVPTSASTPAITTPSRRPTTVSTSRLPTSTISVSKVVTSAPPSPFSPTIVVRGNTGTTIKNQNKPNNKQGSDSGIIHEETTPPRRTSKPTYATPPSVIPPKVVSLPPKYDTTPKNIHNIIHTAHPQDNEIAGSVNIRQDQAPNVNVPFSVENEQKDHGGARLNLGAVVALGAFGGFVFLAAVITTIVILVRRNRTTQHYRHRASPDCNTVASFDSSSSESRNGLNRYYRQAWENLHESASKNHNQNGLRRKETMDAPNLSRSRDNLDARSRDLDRFFDRSSREARPTRDFNRDGLGVRDGSEMIVSDVCVKGEKKRHHHHHHKNNHRSSDFREPNIMGNGRRHY
uniref:CSON012524 protein n=1 Tax=Culicoides sonorensis TaxID=179676 RepID=A0A336LKW4_CULSO